jgi:predicted ribosome quality control (RQC) complex YloA/Tae2 family protein
MNGRHFIRDGAKIVVGRNEKENYRLTGLCTNDDILLEAAAFVGPTTLIRDAGSYSDIAYAASITAHYSDAPGSTVAIRYTQHHITKEIQVEKMGDDAVKEYMV